MARTDVIASFVVRLERSGSELRWVVLELARGERHVFAGEAELARFLALHGAVRTRDGSAARGGAGPADPDADPP